MNEDKDITQISWDGKFLIGSDIRRVKVDDIQTVALMEIAYQLSEIRELLAGLVDQDTMNFNVKLHGGSYE